jgi:hypothetical protein
MLRLLRTWLWPLRPWWLALVILALIAVVNGTEQGVHLRNAWFAAFAVLFYGGLVAVSTGRREQLARWSGRHRMLDSLFIVPLVFLALGLLTPLPLWSCVLGGAVAGAVFAPFAARRRRRLALRPS